MTAPIPPDVHRQIEMIAERVLQRYVSSGPLRNASAGPLSIRDGQVSMAYPEEQGGGTGVYFGPVVNVSTGEYLGTGWLIQAPDGSDIATFRTDTGSPYPLARIQDGQGNSALATDAVSGQGLSRPYLAGQFHAERFADWRYSVTAAEWTTVAKGFVFKQHAQLSVGVRASMDTAGTAGQVRILVEGAQLGDVTTEGFATNNRYFTGPVAGAHMEILTVEIQGRRTTATGTLKLEPIYWVGRPA